MGEVIDYSEKWEPAEKTPAVFPPVLNEPPDVFMHADALVPNQPDPYVRSGAVWLLPIRSEGSQ